VQLIDAYRLPPRLNCKTVLVNKTELPNYGHYKAAFFDFDFFFFISRPPKPFPKPTGEALDESGDAGTGPLLTAETGTGRTAAEAVAEGFLSAL